MVDGVARNKYDEYKITSILRKNGSRWVIAFVETEWLLELRDVRDTMIDPIPNPATALIERAGRKRRMLGIRPRGWTRTRISPAVSSPCWRAKLHEVAEAH